MDIKINAVHFNATTKLEEFIEKKIERLSKHFEGILKAEVTLKVTKPETVNNKEAMVRLVIKGNDMIATKVSDTFEEAVTDVVEALDRQIAKIKDKN